MTTVRINDRAHKVLQEIAKLQQKSMQAILEQAIECYRRQTIFDALDAALDAMTHEELEAYYKENELYEGTLLDGLEEEENE